MGAGEDISGLPPYVRDSRERCMADVVFIITVIAVFALVALVARGVTKL